MNNTLTQFIKVYKNALTSAECKQLIRYFDENESYWGPVVESNGEINVNLDVKRAKQFRVRQEDKDIDDILFKSTGALLQKYANGVNDFFPPAMTDNGYQINKYESRKGFYNWHIDTTAAAICNRVLVIIWYLNTVPKGGETEFKWGKAVNPVEGSALLFPANWLYPHRGNKPLGKAKYIATTWIGF